MMTIYILGLSIALMSSLYATRKCVFAMSIAKVIMLYIFS
ncbi:hypothetical protein LINGRAHAP2_LOCUS26006 [Linum grandiflorum]